MKPKSSNSGISVLMPTYNQASFIQGALRSLFNQTYENWELIIINDGSTDNTPQMVLEFLQDKRIKYLEHKENRGLGASLNFGIENASYDFIAYLPSDDLYYKDHLASLYNALVNEDAILAYSGIVHHHSTRNKDTYGFACEDQIEGYPLQLIQVLHYKTPDRWMEREELVTDDLTKMFWGKLLVRGDGVGTGEATCEWVDHPMQRHKIMNDMIGGGIYLYKRFYKVKYPIRFQSTVGNLVDEIKYYEPFRYDKKSDENGLKILIVGELAYNAERICALEERGHKLYGIWINNPVNFNVVGPLPFGNTEDIPMENWKESIKEIKPDVIYALLNYHAIPLAHAILSEDLGIPFIWHFKEGPFYSRQLGTWNQLIDLYAKSDGQIYTNNTVKEWFKQFLPEQPNAGSSFILDGDLPKKEWFTNDRSTLLSTKDGEIHTVFAGRSLGILPEHIRELADQRIHLHLYGDVFHNQFKDFIEEAKAIAPTYIHTHSNCPQENWVKEFSQYDAGWLHFFKSDNEGELIKANWHDLNYPARISTYAMAGIPMILGDNTDHIVATQSLLQDLDIGIFFNSFSELGTKLKNRERMAELRENVWQKREVFSFDHHVDDLIGFFQKIKSCRELATV